MSATIRMYQVTEWELEVLRQPFSWWHRRRVIATILRESHLQGSPVARTPATKEDANE